MKKFLFVAFALLLSTSALAQRRITIPAGTPEDQALQAISTETDTKKKIAMLEEFVAKYPDNKPALAYGCWQLSQQYAAVGEQAKALEMGDKALTAMPDVMDIIVSQADIAQHASARKTAQVVKEVSKPGVEAPRM